MIKINKIIPALIRISLLLPILLFISGCDGAISDPADTTDDQTVLTLTGTVKCLSTGLAGVTITLAGEDITAIQGVTNSSGKYTFTDLAAGIYKITPSKDGYTFHEDYLNITLKDSNSAGNDFTATANIGTADPVDPPVDPLPVDPIPIDPPVDPVDPPSDNIINLVFTGDINLGTKVGKTVESVGMGDYNFPFINISSYLKSFDLTFGNLESIITDKGQTTKPITGVDLRADPDAINALLGSGFDIVSVANNHAGDFGEDGMIDSFTRVKAAGIDISGGGLDRSKARTPVIRVVKGVRIATLSYSNTPMYMDSFWSGQVPTSRWIATNTRPGIAWAHDTRFETYGDLTEMKSDIAAASASADIVIVMVHFGWEYTYEPDQNQKDLARSAIDSGADLVIGHHPHVIQPVEKYNGGFIAYSLGNFMFDISEDAAAGATRGMIVEATIRNGAVANVITKYTRINELYQVSLEK